MVPGSTEVPTDIVPRYWMPMARRYTREQQVASDWLRMVDYLFRCILFGTIRPTFPGVKLHT
jgi:hypothetical protein